MTAVGLINYRLKEIMARAQNLFGTGCSQENKRNKIETLKQGF